ncbi:MAG: flavodoxin family protein [Gammaproteobacteria bacterium]|jgi:multimeric flavodoxin WrbA
MACVAILYHSGFGHTQVQAKAVEKGAKSVPGTEVHLIQVAEIERHWDVLDRSDAIIFGAPTYMGSVSAGLKEVMEATAERFFQQAWDGKLAAGFTNSGSMSGDKLNTLMDMVAFAAQHGMHWISLGLLGGNETRDSTADELNRLGGWMGAMAQSNIDEGPEAVPPASDRLTAEHLGRRVARAAQRWVAGAEHTESVAVSS